MDIIYEIRRRHSVQKQTITAIARDMGISRPTVRKHLNTVEEPKWLFTPLARFTSLTELNDWLATRCKELAQCSGNRPVPDAPARSGDLHDFSVLQQSRAVRLPRRRYPESHRLQTMTVVLNSSLRS